MWGPGFMQGFGFIWDSGFVVRTWSPAFECHKIRGLVVGLELREYGAVELMQGLTGIRAYAWWGLSSARMYVCMYVRMYVCMYVGMFACMYVLCLYVCM